MVARLSLPWLFYWTMIFGGYVGERLAHQDTGSSGKIIFADQLRAVAALSVMIVHLLGVYWAVREVVATHIFAPVLQGPSAKSLAAISFTYFNFGPFGVSLFFLISGFVIPFSLAKATPLRFLAARALRIYPTYIACLALSLYAIWLSSRYWGLPFGWSFTQVLHNALLIGSVTGIESIDMVNWSLAIEIKFYLLACLLAPWITQGRIAPLVATSLAVAALVVWVAYLMPPASNSVDLYAASVHFNLLVHDLLFIPFMFVGTIFSYRFRGLITQRQLLAGVATLFGIFIAAWPHTVLKDQFPLVPLNYFYALCLFAAAYRWRKHFRPIKLVDWFASVSYPLYALHSLIGYAALRYLGALGVGYYLAVVLAALLVLVLAFAVHRIVELPTQDFGKRIMKRSKSACATLIKV